MMPLFGLEAPPVLMICSQRLPAQFILVQDLHQRKDTCRGPVRGTNAPMHCRITYINCLSSFHPLYTFLHPRHFKICHLNFPAAPLNCFPQFLL